MSITFFEHSSAAIDAVRLKQILEQFSSSATSDANEIRRVIGQATPSIIGRLFSSVNNTTCNVKATPQMYGTELRLTTQPLVRTDYEEALCIADAITSASRVEWDFEDDFIVPFRPIKSTRRTVTVRFAGRFVPDNFDLEEDFVD